MICTALIAYHAHVRVSALIMDFDGVIIDSESTVLVAWQEEYQRHGLCLDLAAWHTQVGSGHGRLDALAALVGDEFNADASLARKRARERELVEAQPLLPGVPSWLAVARTAGIPTAIASSSSRGWVLPHLRRLGLQGSFDVVCCGDDVAAVKPAPDIYLRVIDQLGVHASECIAVEDSPNGITAAKAAGCYCIAVPNPVTAPLDFSQADEILPSLAARPLMTPDQVATESLFGSTSA